MPADIAGCEGLLRGSERRAAMPLRRAVVISDARGPRFGCGALDAGDEGRAA
jgi:hypothetical protein